LKVISSITLVLVALAFFSPITQGFAAPTKQALIFHAASNQAIHVWFDSPPQLTEPSNVWVYEFNVHANTSIGLWITNLHWDFGDGSIKDDPFSGQAHVSELVFHHYADQLNHIVTVTATDNAGNTGSACATLMPDFTLSVAPTSQMVEQGDKTTYNVNVGSVCGISVNVVLSISANPGVTWNFSPNSGNTPFTSTLTIQTARNVPVGTYTLNIVGSDVGMTHSSQVTLNVIPSMEFHRFRLSVAPDPLIMSLCDPPKIVTVTIESREKFDSSVAFTANAPNGMSVAFLPNPVTPPGMGGTAISQGTITISNTLPAGNYPLTIIGTTTTPPFVQRSTSITVQLTGCIPGFPFESILAGIALGVLALACISRRRKPSHLNL
jgi:hypothetical protein